MSLDIVTYGFVDANNILIDTIVVEADNLEFVTATQERLGASASYVIDLSKEIVRIGETYWNGYRFVHPKPVEFPFYIWSDEENDWVEPS